MFTIEYAPSVTDDLMQLTAAEQRRMLDKIDEQLTHEPTVETRNRKSLPGLVPPWDHEPPLWELRVGTLRAFYDVDQSAARVMIRAVRRKPPHKTTKDIL